MGLRVAAFELDGYQPRDELVAISYAEPGRQVSRISKRLNKSLFLFAFRERFETDEFPHTNQQRRAAIEKAFEGVGWECPKIPSSLADVDDIYYDRVSQIHMDHWTKGRVALVGDAAACVSLLAGEGTGLAMAEAYVLAGELKRAHNDHTFAFKKHEDRLMSFLKSKQKSSLSVAAAFVPKTRFGIVCRDLVLRMHLQNGRPKWGWAIWRTISKFRSIRNAGLFAVTTAIAGEQSFESSIFFKPTRIPCSCLV